MNQIMRLNSFETNSSTTHTMIILSEDELKKLQDKELYIDWQGELHSKESLEKEYEDKDLEYKSHYEDFDDWRSQGEYKTLDEFEDSEFLEVESHDYTTKGGETLHIICKFGYDG